MPLSCWSILLFFPSPHSPSHPYSHCHLFLLTSAVPIHRSRFILSWPCGYHSHTSTDVDSIGSAIGGAELFGGTAARASDINSETEFVLNYWVPFSLSLSLFPSFLTLYLSSSVFYCFFLVLTDFMFKYSFPSFLLFSFSLFPLLLVFVFQSLVCVWLFAYES